MRTGKTIAILPARGGSRRLQRKNLYPVFGESMLSWVVKSCRQVEAVEDIYVSSEDAEILAAAEALGCRLIQRPPELAEDEVPKIQAVRHAVRQIEEGDGDPINTIVVTQANSPEIVAADIEGAIGMMERRRLWEVISVDEDLVNNGAFRIIRRHALFNDFLSANIGCYRTGYVDIHTEGDVQRAVEKYGSKDAFLRYKGL